MNDKPREGAVPDQPAAEALQTESDVTSYSGGSALLDAEIEASQQLGSEPLEHLDATNIAGNTDNSSDAQNFTTTGDYPVDEEGLEQNYSAPPNISD